jgi:hypothetical protein
MQPGLLAGFDLQADSQAFNDLFSKYTSLENSWTRPSWCCLSWCAREGEHRRALRLLVLHFGCGDRAALAGVPVAGVLVSGVQRSASGPGEALVDNLTLGCVCVCVCVCVPQGRSG